MLQLEGRVRSVPYSHSCECGYGWGCVCCHTALVCLLQLEGGGRVCLTLTTGLSHHLRLNLVPLKVSSGRQSIMDMKHPAIYSQIIQMARKSPNHSYPCLQTRAVHNRFHQFDSGAFGQETRADTAQTPGPPRSVQISFLLHNICRTCHSSPAAVPGLGRAGTYLFSSVQLEVNQSPSDRVAA